jgi:hypothetical protein
VCAGWQAVAGPATFMNFVFFIHGTNQPKPTTLNLLLSADLMDRGQHLKGGTLGSFFTFIKQNLMQFLYLFFIGFNNTAAEFQAHSLVPVILTGLS